MRSPLCKVWQTRERCRLKPTSASVPPYLQSYGNLKVGARPLSLLLSRRAPLLNSPHFTKKNPRKRPDRTEWLAAAPSLSSASARSAHCGCFSFIQATDICMAGVGHYRTSEIRFYEPQRSESSICLQRASQHTSCQGLREAKLCD